MKRKTIQKEVSFTGTGVFGGRESKVTLVPSKLTVGIVFNVDGIRIPLDVRNIVDLPNRSCLSCNGGRVEVLEHILACLHIAGITDLEVDCPSGEMPFYNGSAEYLWKAVTDAGITTLDENIDLILIKQPMMVEQKNSILMALPFHGLKITYFLSYEDPRIGSDQVSLILDPDTFGMEIASARSFIEEEVVRDLINDGIVNLTDQSEALIVYEDGVHCEFKVESEFAKHKILDLIGDLYLAGRPVKGHFIGVRSGHALNREMIKLLAD